MSSVSLGTELATALNDGGDLELLIREPASTWLLDSVRLASAQSSDVSPDARSGRSWPIRTRIGPSNIATSCEVKARSGDGYGDPREAVGPEKVRRLRRAAEIWLARHPELLDLEVAFEVVGVRGKRIERLPL